METLRYFYHPDPNFRLSVDPLSDKYPNLTPYAYCVNNWKSVEKQLGKSSNIFFRIIR
ncbi:MAG TPA: hypothetical protein GXZ40_05990 [Bacteroidales bacterium]|nr:hypothetical protein [Bacteroidales bacterium]